MGERISNQSDPRTFSGEPEARQLPNFIETTAEGLPARCVDGRSAQDSLQGMQFLGGSIGLVMLDAIVHNRVFDEMTVSNSLRRLKDSGHKIGAHRGSHRNPELKKCDCGFCDQLPHIFETAQNQREEISGRLSPLYSDEAFQPELGDNQTLQKAYDLIDSYNTQGIKHSGDALVKTAEHTMGLVENSQGDHAEVIAWVNVKPQTTLDTRALNKAGKQGFNLDLWAVEDLKPIWDKEYELEAKGIDTRVGKALALILYQATEIVLVEEKGKPALPVAINQ